MSDLAMTVEGLRKWRDGNGKPGAAAILADHEKRIFKEECNNEMQEKILRKIELHHAAEHEMIVDAVSEALSKRSKSREGVIRAFGPYAASISAVLCAIIALWGN